MSNCVLKGVVFKSLQKELNVGELALELAIKRFLDSKDSPEYGLTDKDDIEKFLFTKDMNNPNPLFRDKESYNKALAIWSTIDFNKIYTKEELSNFADVYMPRFGKQYMVQVPTMDSSGYRVFINKPILSDKIVETSPIKTPIETKEEPKEELKDKNKHIQSIEDIHMDRLYNTDILPAEERVFLSQYVMKSMSNIINKLSSKDTSVDMKNRLFPITETHPNGEYHDVDFTTMDRKEAISTIGINTLLSIVKNTSFNIDNKSKVIKSQQLLDRLQLCYDNFDALVEVGAGKFFELEGISIRNNTKMQDSEATEFMDEHTEVGDVAEGWQVNNRNRSVKSGLSQSMRRFLDLLPVINEKGNVKADKYGYKLTEYLDGTEVMTSLVQWCGAAPTINEMEDILKTKTEEYSWVNTILNAIQGPTNSTFRTQFFVAIRRSAINYGIVSADTDANGNTIRTTKIINESSVATQVLQGIVYKFLNKEMTNLFNYKQGALNGILKPEAVKTLQNDVKLLIEAFSAYKSQGETSLMGIINTKATNNAAELRATVKVNSIVISNILNNLGFETTAESVYNSVAQLGRRNLSYDKSTIGTLMNKLEYITNTLSEMEGEVNPLAKGVKGKASLYGDFKSISNILNASKGSIVESSVFQGKKMYYSYAYVSYVQDLVSKLSNSLNKTPQEYANMLEKSFGKFKFFKMNGNWNNWWLERFSTDVIFRKNFSIKSELTHELSPGSKVSYEDLGELGYNLSMLDNFFYDPNKKWAWYKLPILSDKPANEFIKAPRLADKNYKVNLTDHTSQMFQQELMRMRTVLERARVITNPKEGDIKIESIKNYDVDKVVAKNKSLQQAIANNNITHTDLVVNGKLITKNTGAAFGFLPMFNQNIINNDTLGQLIIDKLNNNLTLTQEDQLLEEFRTAFNTYMDQIVDKEISLYHKMGLFDYTEYIDDIKTTNKKYTFLQNLTNNSVGKDAEEAIVDNLSNFIWNNMYATNSIIQLTVTDPTYYGDAMAFQKRYAQIYASGLKADITAVDNKGVKYSSDGIYRTVYLKDLEVVSEHLPMLKEIFYSRVKSGQMTPYEADTLLAEFGYSNTEDGKFVKSKVGDEDVYIKTKEINVTDAQAFSSPTAFRKKLGMYGKWTSEMQTIYDKIKSGNWNHSDITTMLEVIKPFIYSQISKPTGVSTMTDIKVPHQNKNSDFLLVLSDALLQGDSKTSKLRGIYNFMEQTAFTKGEYNGRGIDTIQFESAVKSGLQGLVDINKATTAEEVVDILNKVTYLKDGSYNNQRVHEMSFEDYNIQQEVPNHVVDNYQLVGTQQRILTITDAPFEIFDKKTGVKTKDIQDEYQRLNAENIKESAEALIKEFNLQGTRVEKNEALSKLLIERLREETDYSADLVRACKLDANGEFNIPVSEEITSRKIQQLMNSIITSRINKQKNLGGPGVQVTSFGFSKKLNIVWQDKDGNTLLNKEEFKTSKKSGTYEQYLEGKEPRVKYWEAYAPIPSTELEEALTKADGSLMSIEEAIKTNILTDESLKAIGYRIPTEGKHSLVPIKIVGFLPKLSGGAIALPYEITTVTGSDFDVDKMYLKFKELYKESKNQVTYEKYVEDTKTSKMSYEEWSKTQPKETDRMVEYSLSEGNTREARDNRIFNIQWDFITHPELVHLSMSPSSFDAQKKAAKMITILKNSNEYTYTQLKAMPLNKISEIADEITSNNLNSALPSTQTLLYMQNTTGKKLIGIFANHNVSHGFTSLQDIHLNVKNPVYINGIKLEGSMKLDNIHSLDGVSYISKVVGGYLAASADTAKEPTLGTLNLNTFTAGTGMLLARLGFSEDTISLLLTQPIIEKISTEYAVANNSGYTSADTIIEKKINELRDKQGIEIKPGDLNTNMFTNEDLAEQIQLGAQNIVTPESGAYQAQVLLLFSELQKYANHLGTLTSLTKYNSLRNAAGPTIADNLILEDKHNRFMKLMEGKNPPFNEAAKDVITNSPILDAFYSNTIGPNGLTNLIFNEHFPHYTQAFKDMLVEFGDSIKGKLSEDIINKLVNEFLLYKLTMGENPVFDMSTEKRAYLINKFPKDLRNTIDKLKAEDDKLITNPLLSLIKFVPASKKVSVETIELNIGGYSSDIKEKIGGAWEALFKNEATKELAMNLWLYNIVRNGLSFSPKTFIALASVGTKQSVPSYINTIRDVEFNNDRFLSDTFISLYKRNHSNDRRIVPEIPSKVNVRMSGNQYIFEPRQGTVINEIYLGTPGTDSGRYMDMIRYGKKLLQKVHSIESENEARYIETTPLGAANNFLEYDGNVKGGYIKSVIGQPIETEMEDIPVISEEFEDRPFKEVSEEALGSMIVSLVSSDQFHYIAEHSTEATFNTNLIAVISDLMGTKDEAAQNRIQHLIKEFNNRNNLC